jgi:hypothetical protein
MHIADELRTVGLTVIEGRSGIGRTTDVLGIETRATGTGKGEPPADDVNLVAVPNRATAFIERSGRVWLLAAGPVAGQDNAIVYVAAYRESDINAEQDDALAVLYAVLGDVYGVDPPATVVEPTDAAKSDTDADADDVDADA